VPFSAIKNVDTVYFHSGGLASDHGKLTVTCSSSAWTDARIMSIMCPVIKTIKTGAAKAESL
jgi:hypothetical protein